MNKKTVNFDDVLKGLCECVYKQLGVYHRERTYQNALELELLKLNINVIKEYPLKIWYKGNIVNTYFIDLVIDNKLPIEIKQVKSLGKSERHQILNYMKNIKSNVGYLINFGHFELEILKFVGEKETELLPMIDEKDEYTVHGVDIGFDENE